MRKIRSENVEPRVPNEKTCSNELSFLPNCCNESTTIKIFQHVSLLEVWNARKCLNTTGGKQKPELRLGAHRWFSPSEEGVADVKTHSDHARWPPRRVSRNSFSPGRPDKCGSSLQCVPGVRRETAISFSPYDNGGSLHTWLAAGETLHAVYIYSPPPCDRLHSVYEDGQRALNGHARIRLPWKTYVQRSVTKVRYSASISRTGLFLNATKNTGEKYKSCIHFFYM